MAKNKFIKRVLLKNGGIRYYENGKRLKDKTGVRKYIKQKYAPLPDLKPEDFKSLKTQLTQKELLSLKRLEQAKKSYKYRGIPKVPYAYVEILKKIKAIPQQDPPNKDLYELFKPNGERFFPFYDDIKKLVDDNAKEDELTFLWCNEVGLPGYRGRDFESFSDNTLNSIVDIITLLNSPSFRSWKFKIYDRQGDEFIGRRIALLALKDFEIFVGTIIQKYLNNSAYLRFCYSYTLLLKEKTIFIDLTDINKKLKIEDYFTNQDTTAKRSIDIKGKYRDVVISVDFS